MLLSHIVEFDGGTLTTGFFCSVSVADVAPSLLVGMGADDITKPDYQLGSGCLVDQLVGQYMSTALQQNSIRVRLADDNPGFTHR